MPSKSKIQAKIGEICTYFLNCKSVKGTAKHFEESPETIRKVLAANDIDFWQVRSEHLESIRNPRGAGRKSTGLRRQITIAGLSREEADRIDSVENKSEYIRNLVKKDVEENR
jgi:hypothetical protein